MVAVFVMGVHWDAQNTSKYITLHVMYFDVFCVSQWAPITNTATIRCGNWSGIEYYRFFCFVILCFDFFFSTATITTDWRGRTIVHIFRTTS